MDDRLVIITPTGDRPEAWELCQQWMLAQDYAGPVRWIIVDDGKKAQEVTFERDGWTLDVIRPKPRWRHGDTTQCRNILCALEAVSENDRIVFIEDDDYYAPHWISAMARMLDVNHLVGISHSKYYNVHTSRFQIMPNGDHASLSCTALRGTAIESLNRICRDGSASIDVELWAECKNKALFSMEGNVGIKGLPGRGGMGVGHRKEFGRPDPGRCVLKRWIGDDVRLYR